MAKKLLVIGHVWPEPKTTAAGSRMLQLLESFISFGYEITFASTAAKTGFSLDLTSLGITEATIVLNHSSFDDFLVKLKPDMVIFDRFMVEEQFGWRVVEFAPKALRILNTEDLHSLRKAREEAAKKDQKFTLDQWRNHPMTLREASSIYRSDITLMISPYEMDLLQQELAIPEALLFHLPFMADAISPETVQQWPSFEERSDFVCIGNGKHAPNVDSLAVLKNTIWPLIRKELPSANLYIYGAYLPQMVKDMHHPKTGFHVEGWAENVGDVLQKHRLLLAPLRFGAGIKGKLLDAMIHGIPSITTSIGSEGMHAGLPWNGTVTDDWASFARAAMELYQHQKQWTVAQTNGTALINTLYQKETLQNRLKIHVSEVIENLVRHRDQNFIGQLLHHETLTSTKYLAKWIEEKNRR
ncbi:glycosyltransferase [Flagellimonas amoyensis]|uniref:glycosyltransferase n=1 Tax=Flagellimonas amoyensis TaxID=2169401 RepID=UPI000D34C468|nr:glycosyltransferase [Allomuricauda amoyensis]